MRAPDDKQQSPVVLALAEDLRRGRRVARLEESGCELEAIAGREHLWVAAQGRAHAFVLRACSFMAGPGRVRRMRRRKGEALRLCAVSLAGEQEISLRCHDQGGVPVLELTCRLTSAQPLVIPFLPRDLFPLDSGGSPGGAGKIEAAQRGLNSGFCFLRREDVSRSTLLYWQDLTALNPYFAATGTKPDGAVGGEWPELGFRLPTAALGQAEEVRALPAGRTITLSRALVALHDGDAREEADLAAHFLTLSGAIYHLLERPRCEWRDWPARAAQTAKDLARTKDATVRHYGQTYVRPYLAGEVPDSMSQIALLAAMREWESETGESRAIADALQAGLGRFFDPKLGALRRYLPNARDKNRDEVDSWYLYYPLLGLARMALAGETRARGLYCKSIDFAIRAARHFDYRFPIKFDINSFAVLTEARGDEVHGQTDVAGLYAYVMLQGFELTGEGRFLDEARAALTAAQGLRFNLNYQANLTAWGAAAATRLWRITAEEDWRRLGYIYLASFLHNCSIWESEIGHARHFRNFLGATALHDAPYMAVLECSESFLAFQSLLHDAGSDLLPAARLMIDEYCRFALDRAWFYYPDTLPEEVLASEPRQGRIARHQSFPLEDLYVDGQECGQVGQEIYGAGAGFAFASRAFHDVEGADFSLSCDSFIFGCERPSARSAVLTLAGAPQGQARLSVIPHPRKRPRVKASLADGRAARGSREDRRTVFLIPANSVVVLEW